MKRKCEQRQYTHVQVPFVTRGGVETTCDEGLFDILTLLKEAGVETHYSCQGAEFGGYICAFTPGMQPVVARALQLHEMRWLSVQSTNLLDEWRSGYREITDRMGVHKKLAERQHEWGPQHFAHERETNGIYGDRTTIRWPKTRTHELHQLLIELALHI